MKSTPLSPASSPRLPWLDAARGVCMVLVYLAHAEIYYGTGGAPRLFPAYEAVYVNAFFFVSGYLLLGHYLQGAGKASGVRFARLSTNDLRREGARLLWRLAVPMWLFSTLLFVPKMWFHAQGLSLADFAREVLGGTALWFPSTLLVAQAVLLLLLRLRAWRAMELALAALAVMLAGSALCQRLDAADVSAYFPYFYRTALVYTLPLALGGVYRGCEARVDGLVRRALPLLLLLYAALVALHAGLLPAPACSAGLLPLQCINRAGHVNALGFLAAIVGTLLLTALCKRLCAGRALRFIGRHSLIFYFLCGALPAALGSALHRLALPGGYALTLLCAALSLGLAAAVAAAVDRYAPWLLDLRSLRRK